MDMSEKKYVIFRSLPLERDSRTKRYKHYLGNVIFNCWEDNYSNRRNGIEKIKIGRKDFRLFITYPFYLLYLFIFSVFNLNKNTVAVCMDIDTYIPVKIGSLFRRSKVYLDIVDPISQTKFRRAYFNVIFDYIEYFILKNSNNVILPGESRVKYYHDKINANINSINSYHICENVPVLSENRISLKKEINIDKKVIGYFGSLDSTRGILELISYFKGKDDFIIYIAGRGELESVIVDLSNENENIYFYGSYNSTQLEYLYSNVDFCWAFYSPDVFLHRYACPNKYYEHLAFKTPIIFNEIVPMSKLVEVNNSGLVISDVINENSFSELEMKLNSFNINLSDFGLWESTYGNYSFSLK